MKRLLTCILAAAMLLSLAACGKHDPTQATHPSTPPTAGPTKPSQTIPQQTEPEPTEPQVQQTSPLAVLLSNRFLDKWTDEGITLACVSWQELRLDPACAGEYQQLQQVLEAWNLDMQDIAAEELRDILFCAQEDQKVFGDEFEGYTCDILYAIQRADSRFLSVLCSYAYNIGSRYTRTACLNLDTATGQPMQLSDVLVDWTQLPALLTKLLQDKYGQSFPGTQEYLESFAAEDYIWTMSYQGLTFHFTNAMLESPDHELLSVTLWFDEYAELYAQDYSQAPRQGYATRIPTDHITDVDLVPGDGMRDSVSVSMGDYMLFVSKNDQVTILEDCFGYTVDTYLVTADNRTFYLYAEVNGDNDYSDIYVFDLSGEKPRLVEGAFGTGFAWKDVVLEDGSEEWVFPVFNDPSRFVLDTRVELLGTMSGLRVYHADPQTGKLVAQTDYLDVSGHEMPLTSLMDLQLMILPEGKTETVPAGTVFHFLRSDNSTYVDMRMSDGRECRIMVTLADWEPMVNGMPAMDCFDGILFAG